MGVRVRVSRQGTWGAACAAGVADGVGGNRLRVCVRVFEC